jgi:hypothetical protein
MLGTNDPMSNKGTVIPVKEYFKPPDPKMAIANIKTRR